MESLGKSLKAMRKMRNMTQAQVASKAGLERTSITNIEAGKQVLTERTLHAIAAALGYQVKVRFVPITTQTPTMNMTPMQVLQRLYQEVESAAPDKRELLINALEYISDLEHRNAALLGFANKLLEPDNVTLIQDGMRVTSEAAPASPSAEETQSPPG